MYEYVFKVSRLLLAVEKLAGSRTQTMKVTSGTTVEAPEHVLGNW